MSKGLFTGIGEHPVVAGYLQDVNLGDSDLDPTHWLIIDRERALLYVARVSTAQAFLRGQHPFVPERTYDEIAQLQRQMQEQRRALDVMLAFLDQATAAHQTPPPNAE